LEFANTQNEKDQRLDPSKHPDQGDSPRQEGRGFPECKCLEGLPVAFPAAEQVHPEIGI